MNASRLLPAGMRLATLACRFLLVFALARFLPVHDVGLYGLFAATLTYALYPVGFDFYTYATRQIMRGNVTQRRSFIASQLTFASCTFTATSAVIVILFAIGILPWSMAGWFFLILPLEYLGAEIDRLLIAMSDQYGASLILFLGGALAPIFSISSMIVDPGLRNLTTIMSFWALFDAIALTLGAMRLVKESPGNVVVKIDWKWILNGARSSFPFLVGTLCLRALFVLDRQAVKLFTDLPTLAAYTLFSTVGAGVTSVLYSGIQQFKYPVLVKAAHGRDLAAFKRGMREIFAQTLAGAVTLSLIALAAERPLLTMLHDQVYHKYAWTLTPILIVVIAYNLSVVPHYGLYALDADKQIIRTTAVSLVVFVILLGVLGPLGGVTGVLVALGVSTATLTLGKYVAYRRCARLFEQGCRSPV